MKFPMYLNYSKNPSPVCAYLRELAGWCDNVVELDRPGKFKAKHGDYGTIIKYYSTYNPNNEYFVIENRFKKGLDKHLPSSGLAVYHCDIEGSNEWQHGHPQYHYQCALLQADGHRDLEADLNKGDEGDLFGEVKGEALSRKTNPSTRLWDGSDSELRILNIGKPGEVIEFEFSY